MPPKVKDPRPPKDDKPGGGGGGKGGGKPDKGGGGGGGGEPPMPPKIASVPEGILEHQGASQRGKLFNNHYGLI